MTTRLAGLEAGGASAKPVGSRAREIRTRPATCLRKETRLTAPMTRTSHDLKTSSTRVIGRGSNPLDQLVPVPCRRASRPNRPWPRLPPRHARRGRARRTGVREGPAIALTKASIGISSRARRASSTLLRSQRGSRNSSRPPHKLSRFVKPEEELCAIDCR